MKDNLIKDIEIKLTMQGYSRDETEKIIHCVIGCLGNYEVSAAVTDLTVRYEDQNEQILKRYVVCMKIDGKPDGTIAAYLWTLQKLSDLIRKPFPEMTANDIRNYLGNLKMNDCKNSYIKNQRSYISAFTKWMISEELISKDPILKVGKVKEDQEVRLPLSPVDIDRLRSAITGRNAIRNRAIVETLLSSGIRCEELCNLQIDDVDLKERTLFIRKGKGSKDRITYISEVAADYILKYLEKRKDKDLMLFRSERGETFSVNGIEKMLSRYAVTADVDNVHPHRFRRTFATTCYRRGMDLEEIRRLMGHTNIQTTLRYIYSDDVQLKAAYNKYAA